MTPLEAAILKLNPSLYWPMSDSVGAGSVVDKSGFNRNGTPVGIQLGSPGFFPLYYPRTNAYVPNSGYVQSTYSPFVAGSRRTFMGWAKRATFSDWDGLFQDSTNGFVGLYIDPNLNDVRFANNGTGTNVPWVGAWPGLGQLVNWALTYNDATKVAELFIGGVSKGTNTMSLNYNAGAGTFNAGIGIGSPWTGPIQDVVVFERILTPAEIASVNNVGVVESQSRGSFAAGVYDRLAPVVQEDGNNGWAFEVYTDGLSEMFQVLDDYARDQLVNGEVAPGWSQLLDINRCPTEALPWLAQFVGVTIPPGTSDANARALIQGAGGWNRGTVASMVAAAQQYLTGTKSVSVLERDVTASPSLPAYGLTVYTKTSETPDSTKVLNALMSQKPAGIILNYQVIVSWTYQGIFTGEAAYSNIFSSFVTYQGVWLDQPGT